MEEEDSNKTTALKKAYAEILLNTAKESAARVMVSDSNSAKLHHELFCTKEEALRLLVRMKQMLDSKSVEAEVVLLKKEKEIELLEAQLQEAEEIVTDLRSELRYVRGKLEKAKAFNELQNNAGGEIVVGSLDSNQEVVGGTCEALMSESLLLRGDECGNDGKRFDGLSVDTSKGSDVCESELDVSIRNKKLELSRNGCAQRIHALERKSPCANEEEQYRAEKDILGNTKCLVLALRSMDAELMITKPLGVRRSRKRGRKNKRWGKRKATAVISQQSQLIKPCQSQCDLHYSDGQDSMETHLSVESEEEDACKGLVHHLQHKRTLYTDDTSIIRDGKRSKNMVESCKESNLVSINVEYAEKVTENETEINPLPPLDPGLTDVTICSENAIDRSTDKDLKPRKEVVLVKCEGEENSVVPSTKGCSELVNQHSNSEVIAVVSESETPRANVNRLLMYTFQRKRKKGSLIGNNDNTREVKDKENNAQEPSKSTLRNEPSRETPMIS